MVVAPSSMDDRGNNINQWEQFVYTVRTQVSSRLHNLSAVLTEAFGGSWRPTCDSVWLLGRRYDTSAERSTECAPHGGPGTSCGSSADFAAAWAQITRMTYRKGFAPMYRPVRQAPTRADERRQQQYIELTSDAGWGCMIRVGQMLLATALKRHHESWLRPDAAAGDGGGGALADRAGDAARVDCASACCLDAPGLELQFLDDPCVERSPFSIFGFIRTAMGSGVATPAGDGADAGGVDAYISSRPLTQKLPGDWFGPTTISETIAALVRNTPGVRDTLAVYVNADGMLYEDEVHALASGADAHTSLPSSPNRSPEKLRGGGGDSDDEFMVLSTASVDDCGSTISGGSPVFPTMQAQMSQAVEPPHMMLDSSGEFEEARAAECFQLSSFTEADAELQRRQQPAPRAQLPLGGAAEEEYCCCSASEHDVLERAGMVASPRLSASDSPAKPGSMDGSNSHQAARGGRGWVKAVLLLFPLQLGSEKCINAAYASAVLRYFGVGGSLGAMGGRPRMAHFFVGRDGRDLLYVDPHVVQAAAVPTDRHAGECDARGGVVGAGSFRNAPTVQAIPIEQIDSSISLAFYCRGEADLTAVIAGLREVEEAEANALIHTERTRPPALRRPRLFDATPQGPWCDIDGLCHSFTEVVQQFDGLSEDLEVSKQTSNGQACEGAFHLVREAGGVGVLVPDVLGAGLEVGGIGIGVDGGGAIAREKMMMLNVSTPWAMINEVDT